IPALPRSASASSVPIFSSRLSISVSTRETKKLATEAMPASVSPSACACDGAERDRGPDRAPKNLAPATTNPTIFAEPEVGEVGRGQSLIGGDAFECLGPRAVTAGVPDDARHARAPPTTTS